MGLAPDTDRVEFIALCYAERQDYRAEEYRVGSGVLFSKYLLLFHHRVSVS